MYMCRVRAVRDGDTVKHYRIRQLDEGGFFIARRVTFRSLSELVEHYGRDADGLCVNLKKPCSLVSWFVCQNIYVSFWYSAVWQICNIFLQLDMSLSSDSHFNSL